MFNKFKDQVEKSTRLQIKIVAVSVVLLYVGAGVILIAGLC